MHRGSLVAGVTGVAAIAAIVSLRDAPRVAAATDAGGGAEPLAIAHPSVVVSAWRPPGSPMPVRPEETKLADALVAEAFAVLAEDPVTAREVLEDALAVDPRHVGALRALGQLRLDAEDENGALDLASRCLAEAPADAACRTLRRLALARTGRGDLDDAERCYAESPDDFTCIAILTNERIKQRRFLEARALVDELRTIEPDGAMVPMYEATIAITSGNPVTALPLFETACARGQEWSCSMAVKLRAG